MPLSCKCPGCQQVLTVPDSAAGGQVKCPKCATVLAIAAPKPAAQAATPQPAAQQPAMAGAPATQSAPKAAQAPASTPAQKPQPAQPAARQASPAGKPQTGGGGGAGNATGDKKAVACPKCKTVYKVGAATLGKKIKCKKCQAVFATGPTAKKPAAADALLTWADVAPAAGAGVAAGADTMSFDAGDTATDIGDPFGGGDLGGAPAAGGLDNFGGVPAAAPAAAPSGGGGFAAPAAAPAGGKQKAKASPKSQSVAGSDEVIYKLPAIIGMGCAGFNLLIVTVCTILGIMAWTQSMFIRSAVMAIGLILVTAGTTFWAQIYAINGFIGVLRMVDRHGGIMAAKGILACPFITAIVIAMGLGGFGIPVAGAVWVFMLLYNWPIGWWLWLKLEKDECARHFGEVTHDDAEVNSLLSGKKKQDSGGAAAPAWTPTPQSQPQEPATKSGKQPMSADTKKKLILVGGAVGAILLIGGVVGVGALVVMSGSEPADPIPVAPEGFTAVTFDGVTVFIPGTITEPKVGAGDMQVVEADSDNNLNYFFFAVGFAGPKKASDEGVEKSIGFKLQGDFRGARPFERNGYSGWQGRLMTSSFYDDMPLEVFQHDGRLVIMGYNSNAGDYGIDERPDQEIIRREKDTFYESLFIGKKAQGMLGF